MLGVAGTSAAAPGLLAFAPMLQSWGNPANCSASVCCLWCSRRMPRSDALQRLGRRFRWILPGCVSGNFSRASMAVESRAI